MTIDIHGRCHCGGIAFELAWPAMPLAARRGGCTFCRKHGAVWTAHPAAVLRVRLQGEVSRYRFGTQTAEFLVCMRCGVPAVAISTIGGHDYAVVNINTFEGTDVAAIPIAPANFDGENEADRLARREKAWIADVRIG